MRQVVTELDSMAAVYDYLAWQLDDRLRYEYTEEMETIDALVQSLRDPLMRIDASEMKRRLMEYVTEVVDVVVNHEIMACPCGADTSFYKAFVNLIWNAHENTAEWLREQVVVVGQSTN